MLFIIGIYVMRKISFGVAEKRKAVHQVGRAYASWTLSEKPTSLISQYQGLSETRNKLKKQI
jgi:hypothetical protein